MSKYPKLADYEGFLIDPKEEVIHFACCDCALVHVMALAHEDNGKIGVAFKRESRATAQLRRHEYGGLQQRRGGRYRMVRMP